MTRGILDDGKPRLGHRERFQRQMHFQTVDRGVHWEFGYLQETRERWYGEGLPTWLPSDTPIERYFGVDPVAGVPVINQLCPVFSGDVKVLEETPGRRVEELPDGTVQEVQTQGTTTIPHYIKMPIADRDDWKRFKERLDPSTPDRHVFDYRTINEELRHIDAPVGISFRSFFGSIRNWVGFEQVALMMYDDPDLVEEMVETLTRVMEATLEPALREVKVDFAAGWEDICFNNGPIMSPAMFRSIVAPRIKRVCDLLRFHGVDVIWTDCDGNINDLVPIWLESGLNCMFPIEVRAGSDPVELRRKYGKRILLRGGVDKTPLSKGKPEILAELKKLEKTFEEGGFLPGVDHRVPQDVSLENYRYYIREKLAMMGWPKWEVERIAGLADKQ